MLLSTTLITQYLARIDSDLVLYKVNSNPCKTEIGRFLEDPNTAALNAVRAAWLRAHSAYELTTVHRHFAQTVVDESSRLNLFSLQYQINHWPIFPGYLDYLDSYPESGIVNDMTVPLTANDIRAQHGLFDVNEAAIGFHALEFLIWEKTLIALARGLSVTFKQSSFSRLMQRKEDWLWMSFPTTEGASCWH